MNVQLKVNIEPSDLMNGINFYGETNADMEALKKVKELNQFLGDTIYAVNRIKRKTDRRDEASAKEIKAEIIDLYEDIIQTIFPEKHWEEVINLLHKEVALNISYEQERARINGKVAERVEKDKARSRCNSKTSEEETKNTEANVDVESTEETTSTEK